MSTVPLAAYLAAVTGNVGSAAQAVFSERDVRVVARRNMQRFEVFNFAELETRDYPKAETFGGGGRRKVLMRPRSEALLDLI